MAKLKRKQVVTAKMSHPDQNVGRKLIPALSAAASIVFLLAFGASARNGLHESAVKIASEQLQQQLENHSVPQLNETHLAGKEVMPANTRAAKNRPEAKAVVSPLIASNSAITYDPWGRLVKIVDPGSVTRQFIYAGDRLSEERDGSGNVTKQFFDWGEVINGTKYFYTRNHEDSVTEMTDSSGNIVAQYQYDPWGNVTRIAGAGPDSDFRYAGYFYHQPSGLYITAHRLYNPKLGRWLNRDPIDDPTFAMMPRNPGTGGPTTILMPARFEQDQAIKQNADMMTVKMVSRDPMVRAQLATAMNVAFPQAITNGMPQTNPYQYVSNNPINKRDPSGLDEDWAWCSTYCTLTTKGALSWIICMEECMRGFPPHHQPCSPR